MVARACLSCGNSCSFLPVLQFIKKENSALHLFRPEEKSKRSILDRCLCREYFICDCFLWSSRWSANDGLVSQLTVLLDRRPPSSGMGGVLLAG